MNKIKVQPQKIAEHRAAHTPMLNANRSAEQQNRFGGAEPYAKQHKPYAEQRKSYAEQRKPYAEQHEP
ncbi:hypothetical protein U1Q18_011664 [Sarracenia purpurea var. burkii]